MSGSESSVLPSPSGDESPASRALSTHAERLIDNLRELAGCLVAFSGGVDSAVVAKAAVLALADRAIAITADSPSLAAGELDEACEVAKLIGIRHRVIHTNELARAEYRANSFDRCFHCKTELYSELTPLLAEYGVGYIVNGANQDDLADYRPGRRAAEGFAVVSPLAACGLSKSDVRALARQWKLSVADKPATPCLSSRIAYGEAVTPARLAMIDQAEQWLKQRGLGDVRVRYHQGDLARLEVALEQVPRLSVDPLRSELTGELQRLGFKFVTLDLQGRRSGSLNTLVPLEQLRDSVG